MAPSTTEPLRYPQTPPRHGTLTRARRWALDRFDKKRKTAREAKQDEDRVEGESFTIYGRDNKLLKTWTVDKDGEHESDE